jgi:hypothetical protein
VTRAQARSALIVITLIWGVSITAVKGLLGYAAPLTSVAVRFGLAGLVLVPALRGLKRPELRGGLLIGLVFGLGVMFQNLGLAHTTASRSAFIVALSALLTPALGALILGHKPSGIVVARLLRRDVGGIPADGAGRIARRSESRRPAHDSRRGALCGADRRGGTLCHGLRHPATAWASSCS